MSKFKIVNLFDKVFITVAIFLIAYAWINFYVRSLWITFIFSLIVTSAVVFILYYFLNKKSSKIATTNKEKAEINKTFYVFRLTANEERLKLLKKIFENDYKTELKNGMLTYTKDEKLHLVITATKYEIITQNELLCLLDGFDSIKVDFIDVVCNEQAVSNTNIFKDKTINFINKSELYYLLKNANVKLDDNNINTTVNKIKFKDILKGVFTPNKARGYFLCGLVLIFSSLILPYHVYYVVVGSMLMLFSVICKILPLFEPSC